MPRSVRTSMADYVDDVASVAEGLPSSPVVIAHSMGGFVVQHYLQSYAAPAAVLVASTPPQGSIKYVMRQFKRHPLRAILTYMSGKSLRLVGGTPALARENFFSAQTPADLVARNAARLQEERGAKWSLESVADRIHTWLGTRGL